MEQISRDLRKDILFLSHKCGDGNLQSAFSCIDTLWALYDRVMNWSKENATDDNRDICIISKGQATLALYPILIRKGLFSLDEVAEQMGQFSSRYSIQTDVTKFSGGIENNAGSLGHGLPFAVGIAMANKIKGLDSRVFVLCGDGEFTEGTMWESCLLAATHKLDNLCVIIDDNASVGAMIDMGNMAKKLLAFDFATCEVNGHDLSAVTAALKNHHPEQPMAVIAHTVRGYGSKTMTQHDIWFHKAPNAEELAVLQKEVDEFCDEHF